MSERGVSPAVAFTMLVGIVAIAAVSILVASGAILGDVGSSAESQQVENTLVQFDQTATRLASGETDYSHVHTAGEHSGTTAVDESAGHVEFTLVETDGSTETLLSEDLGLYSHEFDDGTEVAYQGGGVWSRGDGETKLVSPPGLQYRDQPEATLTFPIVRLTGDLSEPSNARDEVRVVERQEIFPGERSNPIEGRNLYVDLESRYCDGWERYVDERTDGTVAEGCAESDVTSAPNELRINMSVPRDEPRYRTEGVGLYSEGNVTASNGTLNFNATMATGGALDIAPSTTYNHEGAFVEGVGAIREPHDDEIQDLVDSADPGDWETMCDSATPPCTYEGGQTIYVDDFDKGSSSATFDLQNGDITMVVDDDFRTEDSTQWELENHGGERSVEIYVTGDAEFTGYTKIRPDGGNSIDAINDPPDSTYAEGFQLYLPSDATIAFNDNVQLEMTISAPSNGTGNTSTTSAIGSNTNVDLIGSLYVGDLNLTDLNVDLYQPAATGTGEVSEMEAFGAVEPDLYYLHLSEVTLEASG